MVNGLQRSNVAAAVGLACFWTWLLPSRFCRLTLVAFRLFPAASCLVRFCLLALGQLACTCSLLHGLWLALLLSPCSVLGFSHCSLCSVFPQRCVDGALRLLLLSGACTCCCVRFGVLFGFLAAVSAGGLLLARCSALCLSCACPVAYAALGMLYAVSRGQAVRACQCACGRALSVSLFLRPLGLFFLGCFLQPSLAWPALLAFACVCLACACAHVRALVVVCA